MGDIYGQRFHGYPPYRNHNNNPLPPPSIRINNRPLINGDVRRYAGYTEYQVSYVYISGQFASSSKIAMISGYVM